MTILTVFQLPRTCVIVKNASVKNAFTQTLCEFINDNSLSRDGFIIVRPHGIYG